MSSRAERTDIETMRGLAAILMVMGHVIGNDAVVRYVTVASECAQAGLARYE